MILAHHHERTLHASRTWQTHHDGPEQPAVVPDNPILPFIEGDGTGRDIWRASERVLDAAVAKAYGGKKKIAWYEVYAGEKAYKHFNSWLPEETVAAFRKYLVGIKGPLTTPIGGGIRSLNVALRQMLDLYVCLRPVRWFEGVPSPVKRPQDVDMVIFRENTEDIYAGIEFEAESADAKKILAFIEKEFPADYRKIRFPATTGIGIKPVSRDGTDRLVRAAIKYAIDQKRKSVTFVHKGNIMKYTEGAFMRWGYALAQREFGDKVYTWDAVGEDQGRQGRGRGQRRAEGRARGGQGPRQGRHRRHHAPAGADPREGVRRHRHAEPERRLPERRARGAGRRHRHRARRQHQLRERPRHLRGDARHGAEVRGPRQGQPRLGRSSAAR